MAKIVLVTGGGRSGKSSYAERLAEKLPGPRVYIATTIPFDGELAERVAKHREARSASRAEGSWATVEEPLDLAAAIRACPSPATILVDCLTMWVNNLLWERQAGKDAHRVEPAPTLSETEVAAACRDLAGACREREGVVVFVTNEVGLGVIPGDPVTRLYRDLLGRCNQVMAAAAGTVVLMVSGLPLVLKDEDGLGRSLAP
jgi:adenosylcobinamide kinase/adenosylcobinamide-phosphate guanylyltransferase